MQVVFQKSGDVSFSLSQSANPSSDEKSQKLHSSHVSVSIYKTTSFAWLEFISYNQL